MQSTQDLHDDSYEYQWRSYLWSKRARRISLNCWWPKMVRQLFVYCLIAGERCIRMCFRIAPGWDHKDFKVDCGSNNVCIPPQNRQGRRKLFLQVFHNISTTIQHSTRTTVGRCTLATSIKSDRLSSKWHLIFFIIHVSTECRPTTFHSLALNQIVCVCVCCWMAADF